MKLTTPFELSVLLHCRVMAAPVTESFAQSTLLERTLRRFETNGITELDGETGCHRTTPLGDAWVKAILNTPLPRQVFVDAQGNIL